MERLNAALIDAAAAADTHGNAIRAAIADAVADVYALKATRSAMAENPLVDSVVDSESDHQADEAATNIAKASVAEALDAADKHCDAIKAAIADVRSVAEYDFEKL